MRRIARPDNRHLSREHACSTDTAKEWDQDNQQWWNWYISLAENDGGFETRPLVEITPPPSLTPPTRSHLAAELGETFTLRPEQVTAFRQDGFIKLKNVLPAAGLCLLRRELTALFCELEAEAGGRFSSLEMMWQRSDVVRDFVFSRRLARLAAELLGVSAIRLYHDNGLSKLPGCGRTPWHYDAHHFPIATPNVCTVWIPLQAIPESMGPLGFARGMDLVGLVEDIPFNKFDTSYDRRITSRFREHDVSVESSPFDIGEVSFHHNLCFHTAGPNQTTSPRMVLATTYFEDGARVIDAPHMVNGDWRRFMPGVAPGEVIDTPLNPVLYSSRSAVQGTRR